MSRSKDSHIETPILPFHTLLLIMLACKVYTFQATPNLTYNVDCSLRHSNNSFTIVIRLSLLQIKVFLNVLL